MNKNVVLKKRKIFEENNRLYLKLVYEYEDEHGVYELIIPKLELQIRTDYLPSKYEKLAFATNTLKEKPQEMTIAEIEKKLGYKVKLVSEENKNE